MAEVLNAFPNRKHSRWDKFFDGQVWRVSLSEIGVSSHRAARTSAHGIATIRGFRLRYHAEDEEHCVVQVMAKTASK